VGECSTIQPEKGNEGLGQTKRERILVREKHKEELRGERKRVRRIQALESEVDHLEKRIEFIDSEMTKPELSTDFVRLSELLAEKENLERRRDQYLEEWERLIEETVQDNRENL
jgi:ATP-binding cassette subfamily F protein 3